MSLITPILTVTCCACAVPHSQRGRERGQTHKTFHSHSSFLIVPATGSIVQTPR